MFSKLNYVISSIFTPNAIIKEANSIIFNFLWNGKDKIKRNSVIGDYDEGGLKMIHLESFVRTKHIMWIKRLLSDSFHDWKRIPNLLFKKYGNAFLLFASSSSTKVLPQLLPSFYGSLVNSWEILTSNQEIEPCNQIIWNNKSILINKKSIFISDFFKKGVTFIHQLFNEEGNILSWESFKSKFTVPNYLWIQYMGLTSAIRKQGKSKYKLFDGGITKDEILRPLYFSLKGKEIPLNKASSKQIYESLKSDVFQAPVAKERLIEKFNFNEEELNNIFSLPFISTISNQIRSFQLKIIHNILFLNDFLYNNTTLVPSPLCSLCKLENETLKHLFHECKLVKNFVTEVGMWLEIPVLKKVDIKLMLFGSVNKDAPTPRINNFIILLIKFFLFSCRRKKISPTLKYFKLYLTQYYEIEKVIAKNNNKEKVHFVKWNHSIRTKLGV